MLRLTVGLLFLMCFTGVVQGADLAGYWSGAFDRLGSVQLCEFEFANLDGTWSGKYSIPEMGLYEQPVDSLTIRDSLVSIGILYGRFELLYHGDIGQMTALNTKWNPPVGLHLKRLAAAPLAWYTKRDVTVLSGGTQIHGTLYTPKGPGPFPALIAIHGSGSQSRSLWEYRMYGYALTRLGVAVLVYDKRGCGESGGVLKTATFDTLAADARAMRLAVQALPGIDPNRCGYLGISQGGWIGARLARDEHALPFLVLMEGPAVDLWTQERHRVQYSLANDGFTKSAIDSALKVCDLYFQSTRDSSAWPTYRAAVESADTASWLEYVGVSNTYNDADMHWWRNNAYDPAEDLASIACPVLSLFGEIDPNVPPAENKNRMDSLLKVAGVAHRIVVTPRIPHSVTTFQTLRGGKWDWPKGFWQWAYHPVSIDHEIADFVLGTAK